MSLIKKLILGSALTALSATAMAHPDDLITHNKTSGSVYATIGGVRSNDPVAPNKTKYRKWFLVNMACFMSKKDNKCTATISVEKNNQESILGDMTIDLESGEITPTQISNDKYTLNVIDTAEVEVVEK